MNENKKSNKNRVGLREVSGIQFDPETRMAYVGTRGNGSLKLTRREADLLTAFMDDPDRVLTRQELHARVWGRLDTTFRVVDAYVSRLRTKLRNAGHPGIGSVRMRGYLMLSPTRVS